MFVLEWFTKFHNIVYPRHPILNWLFGKQYLPKEPNWHLQKDDIVQTIQNENMKVSMFLSHSLFLSKHVSIQTSKYAMFHIAFWKHFLK